MGLGRAQVVAGFSRLCLSTAVGRADGPDFILMGEFFIPLKL